MRRRGFLVAVTTAALLVGTFGVPIAAADVGGPGLPSEPTTLILTESLTLSADHVGNVVIAGNDVVLDCAGHAVSGPPSDPGLSGGIEIAGGSRVTVRDCLITGFVGQNGIFGYGSEIRLEHDTIAGNDNNGIHLDSVSHTTIVGNTVRDNGLGDQTLGIVLTGSASTTIRSNVVMRQGWSGIALMDGTIDSIVEDNTVVGGGAGILVQGASNGNTIRGNIASRNTDGISILASSRNLIVNNTANSNASVGFSADWGSSSNTFDGNTANLDNDGFNLHGANLTVVVGNTANRNRHAGFLVWDGSSDNVLSGNTGLNNVWFDAYDEVSGTGDSWYGNTFRTTSGI